MELTQKILVLIIPLNIYKQQHRMREIPELHLSLLECSKLKMLTMVTGRNMKLFLLYKYTIILLTCMNQIYNNSCKQEIEIDDHDQ